ncbi:MAG: lysine--tRNA ligase [Patescibacteria group bacterium]
MIEEEQARRDRLASIINKGENPYPSTAQRTHMVSDFLNKFDSLSDSDEVIIAGRLKTIRKHGGLTFAHIQDESGMVQLVLHKDKIGDEQYGAFHDTVDMGDFVEAKGNKFVTKKGEQSLDLVEYKIISKALLPLPEKWHGLADVEKRFRERELDILSNPEVRPVFHKRAEIIRALREGLDKEGFEEVETPILQSIAGGATARPFVTHHNSLDHDFYLRIAPELYLKRCIVAGFEKVYELGRQFRNEGIDISHNPEFTSLEFYWAYKDYNALMDFTEKYLSDVIKKVAGSCVISYQGQDIDFTPPWPRKTFQDAVKEAGDIDISEMSKEEIVEFMKKRKIECDPSADMGKIYDELYKELVRKPQVQPVFITDYPIEMEPLAKKCEDDPRFVQRFQLITASFEILKAYSELNDPIDQLERFEAQQELRKAGDDEAQNIDEMFVKSLKYGLPPTAGWGMGVDRFVMLLTDQKNIKEVILFPTLRPKE